MSFRFSYLIPSMAKVSRGEIARASIGAFLGIFLTGFITHFILGSSSIMPMLVAPMGASAVLLFATPTSPLAQPWSIVGGNLIASIVGVTILIFVNDMVWGAAIAVLVSISLMFVLRCLHPPSGAVALTIVLSGTTIAEFGHQIVLLPIGINSVALLIAAILFNNLSGRRYPHIVVPSDNKAAEEVRGRFLRTQPQDLNAVLRQYDEVVGISPDQLDWILSQAQLHAYKRKVDGLTCGDIMSSVYNTISPQTRLKSAWATMGRAEVNALPVIADNAELVGIVSQSDFIKKRIVDVDGNIGSSPFSNAGFLLSGAQFLRVEQIMTKNVQSALPETPIVKLIPALAEQGLHQIPVVDSQNTVVGMVTQAALIAALFNGTVIDNGSTDVTRSVPAQ